MAKKHTEHDRPNPDDPNPSPAPGHHDAGAVPPDSAVDLGKHGVVPPPGEEEAAPLSASGHSMIDWGSLVEGGSSKGEPAPLQIDSPSDLDLLAMAQAEAEALGGDTHPVGDRAHDAPTGEDALAAELREVGEFLAMDSGTLHASPDSGIESSAVELGGKPTRPAEDRSGLDLQALQAEMAEAGLAPSVPPGEEGPPSDESALNSGIDLLVEELAQKEPSTNNLGSEPISSFSDHPSGRDLIAEAVESGVDLHTPHLELSKSEPSDVSLGESPPATAEPSSAIDLGGEAIRPHRAAANPHLPPSDSGLRPIDSGSLDAAMPSSSRGSHGADDILEPEMEEEEEILHPEVMPSGVLDSGVLDPEVMDSGVLDPEMIEEEGHSLKETMESPTGLPPLLPDAEAQDEFRDSATLPALDSHMGASGGLTPDMLGEPEAAPPTRRRKRLSEVDLGETGIDPLGLGAEMGPLSGAPISRPPSSRGDSDVDFHAPPPSGASVPVMPPEMKGDSAVDLHAPPPSGSSVPVMPEEAIEEADIDLAGMMAEGSQPKAPPTIEDAAFAAEEGAGFERSETTAYDTRQKHDDEGAIDNLDATARPKQERTHRRPPSEQDMFEPAEMAEEQPIEEPIEEEEPPARPSRPEKVKRGGGLLVGTLLGAILGVGGVTGAWVAGWDPPDSLREMAGTKKKAAGGDEGNKQQQPNEAQAAEIKTLTEKVAAAEKLAKDNQAKADEADAAKANLAKAEENAKRAVDNQTKAEKDAKKAKDELAKAMDDSKADATMIQTLKKEKLDAEKLAKEAKDDVDAAKKELTKAADDLKTTQTKLTQAMLKATDLAKANEESSSLLGAIAKELIDANYIKSDAKPEAVAEGIKTALKLAKEKDPAGLVRKLENEVQDTKGQLKARRTPEQMLAYWRPLLESSATPGVDVAASEDAARVLADKNADAATKARASAVQGLALKNQGKYAEAKAALEKAKAALGDKAWLAPVETALREVTDPAGTLLAQAEALRDRGKDSEAMVLLDRGLTATPNDARLLAARALANLDRAQITARVAKDAKALKAAEADAQAAAKAGSAAGHYALGRVAEETGDFTAAVKSYREALAAHKQLDAESYRYRAALARVLLQAKPAAGKKEDAKISRLPALRDTLLTADPTARRMALVLMLTTLVDAEGLDKNQEDAQKLADEILAAKPGTVPPEVVAQALAIKGLYTEAITTYVEGLRPYLKRDQVEGLLAIVRSHPLLKQPETLTVQDPDEAQKFYFNGRSQYNNRRWAEAERSFRTAIKQFNQDARFYYYLGLTRLAQNENDAMEFFRQGAKLEKQNRPGPDAVDRDLENIQNNWRRRLDAARKEAR